MADDLTIPTFLDLRIPANLDRWREGRKNWRPSRARREEQRKVPRDSQGRALPRSMDAGSWALLREIETAEARAREAAKAERLRILKANREERQRIKAEAKAQKQKGPTQK